MSSSSEPEEVQPSPPSPKLASIVPALHPLTPKYEPDKHQLYFDAIESALCWTGDQAVRNIALTGSYGVGKSSILRQVAREHEKTVIEISLSTLGFDDSDNPDARGEDTKTNRIQKEIVKQLLYTQDPAATPGSRYRRTSGFKFGRAATTAALAALPVTLIFFFLGWTAKLAELFSVAAEWRLAANAGLFVVAFSFVLAIQKVLHNKIRIDSISAGAATIKLSEDSATYFDEYLDEIVYFFEVTKRDLVIFEDIDRFDDAHIFETLRSLNTLLGGSKQLAGHPVRFIYAIKDSIFEDIGTRAAKSDASLTPLAIDKSDAAVLEVARANRTKFFDVVIPVVPFITHQTAREQLDAELNGLDHGISSDLIDLAAQHVADMRLIKNIRNEFVIFREQVITKSALELDDDALFAMVLYKSTHLSDFEQIKLGRSDLDELYRQSRAIVRQNTERLRSEVAEARQKLESNAVGDDRAEQLGERLDAAIARSFRLGAVRRVAQSYSGTPLSNAELRTVKFWHDYAAHGGPIELTYQNRYEGYQSSSSLSEDDIADILGERIAGAAWDRSSRERIERQISSAESDIVFLADADMSGLIGRPEFKLQREEDSPSFADLVRNRLSSRLAQNLLAAGYINRYFTLYTATFVGTRVSANAMNFILKVIDAGEIDVLFALTREDVRSLLSSSRQSLLRERAAFNLDVVDYLLGNDQPGAQRVIQKLAIGGEPERAFVKTHLASDRDSRALIQMLTQYWPGVIHFLITDSDLHGESLLDAADTALSALRSDLNYGGEGVDSFVLEHYDRLQTFTDTETSRAAAHALTRLLMDLHVLLPRLRPLGRHVREAVVEAEVFAVTRDNLHLALGGEEASVALDHLRFDAPHVYARVLRALAQYLALLRDDEVTVSSVDDFEQILGEVLEADRGAVTAVVHRAADECVVVVLSAVPVAVWPVLAKENRFPASFENVAAYVNEFDIDENLAVILAAGVITTGAEVSDSEKAPLTSKLLNSRAVLNSPDLRARLLKSLHPSEYLSPDSVPAEEGEWVGRLIEQDVLEDDAESFEIIPASDWAGRVFAMRVSAAFTSFMSPALLPAHRIAWLMRSRDVPEAVRDTIVRRFEEFTAGVDREGLEAVAEYALQRGINLSFADIAVLAEAHVRELLVLEVLRPVVANATLTDLAPIMNPLGEDYAVLGTPSARRPKLPHNSAVEALLQRFEALGRVSKFVEERGHYRVYLNQRW